jgi:hypothetical protein
MDVEIVQSVINTDLDDLIQFGDRIIKFIKDAVS